MPLKAIAFDAYGTLFDVYSVNFIGRRAVPRKRCPAGRSLA